MIIGIESSCDESAVALFDANQGIIFEEISSQIKLHSEYGGVVPELASREHVKNFVPLLQHLKAAGGANASKIAVTHEPGLPGCVSIGLATAKALAGILNIPMIKINHLHGHAFSPFIPLHKKDPKNFIENLKNFLPHFALLVSGGNTLLFKISSNLEFSILAATVDDAAGEAFDKGAKLLGLPYPGGALIEKFAQSGNPKKYHFPRAFFDRPDMKFSFSGLKTSLRYFLEKQRSRAANDMNDICASYQEAILDALIVKLTAAIENDQEIKSVGISGGVSNNDLLRKKVTTLCGKYNKKICFPLRQHTGDNAAMIAFTAFIQNL